MKGRFHSLHHSYFLESYLKSTKICVPRLLFLLYLGHCGQRSDPESLESDLDEGIQRKQWSQTMPMIQDAWEIRLLMLSQQPESNIKI